MAAISLTTPLAQVYKNYIAAILEHDLDSMDSFVSQDIVHNGVKLGLAGYKALLKRNIMDTSMRIEIKRLVADDQCVAAVLVFTTTEATQDLIGYRLDGQIFSYSENVFYDFDTDGMIKEVHSTVETDIIKKHARQQI